MIVIVINHARPGRAAPRKRSKLVACWGTTDFDCWSGDWVCTCGPNIHDSHSSCQLPRQDSTVLCKSHFKSPLLIPPGGGEGPGGCATGRQRLSRPVIGRHTCYALLSREFALDCTSNCHLLLGAWVGAWLLAAWCFWGLGEGGGGTECAESALDATYRKVRVATT